MSHNTSALDFPGMLKDIQKLRGSLLITTDALEKIRDIAFYEFGNTEDRTIDLIGSHAHTTLLKVQEDE